MNRLLTAVMMLFIYSTIYSQQIPREEADSLIKAAAKSKPGMEKIDVLLKIAKFHLLKTNVSKADFDSASVLIKQATVLNSKIKSSVTAAGSEAKGKQEADGHIALLESCFDRKSGQRETGQQKADKAISLLKEGTNNALLGQAYFEKSNYYDHDFKDPTIRNRIYFIELAIAAGKQSTDIRNLAYYYCTVGDLHHLISQYAKSINELNLSLKYYQSIQHKELQLVYGLLGRVYYLQGDYEVALNHELKAMQIAERNKDTSSQFCAILNTLGFIYYKLNDNENALDYFKKSLAIAERDKDNRSVYLVASNVTETYLKLKRPQEAKAFLDGINRKYAKPKNKIYEAGDYINNKVQLRLYMALQQWDKAKFYCDRVIEETKNPHINLSLLNAYYVEIIQYYTATSQYSQALHYLNKNKTLLDSLKDYVGLARNYNLWFSLDTSQGHLSSAISHILTANKINDSIFNEKKSRQLQQLYVQYESDKKESDIKLKDQQIQVLTQKQLLQQANLREANIIKNITIAGIAILLLVGSLFYIHYRHKQQANKIITDQNKQLKHLLTEKEWLLKEIHHRVKNNLQIVMSLLNSQSAFIDNEPALTAIHDSQHRVQAMSLIHQKLYGSDNVSSIDMSFYIRELVSYLADSFNTGQRIRFELNIEPIEMDVSQAVPLGLILNEAITNSIKYAFADGRNGIIAISFSQIDPHHCVLSIADNGVGIPLQSKNKKPGSLGMTLIKGLSEELDGTFAIESTNGTTIKISFPDDRSSKRSGIVVPSFVSSN